MYLINYDSRDWGIQMILGIYLKISGGPRPQRREESNAHGCLRRFEGEGIIRSIRLSDIFCREDPPISRNHNARTLIQLDRDELLQELVRQYLTS